MTYDEAYELAAEYANGVCSPIYTPEWERVLEARLEQLCDEHNIEE